MKVGFNKFLVFGAVSIFMIELGGTIVQASFLDRSDLSNDDLNRVKAITLETDDFSKAEQFENMAAGAATTKAALNKDVFSQFSTNLTFEGERDFKIGNGLFRKLWVSSPSSTHTSDGLGPFYNARSCQRCHLKDGRGHPPENTEDRMTSMILKLAALSGDKKGTTSDPIYGGQLQDFAVPGIKAEGHVKVTYEEREVTLKDGTIVKLRKPKYSIDELAYGPLDETIMMSPRVAPQMIGLGLLEAIHPADILAKNDPDDKDGDGISGRPNFFTEKKSGKKILGRFGWKATTQSVAQQSANAFAGDIGISSEINPDPWGDCTSVQAECRNMPHGVNLEQSPYEASKAIMGLVVFYSKNLAVPARRDANDEQVLRGKELFYQSGCVSCHTPKYVTSRKAEQPEHRFQLIWPYTDLLLHDMGDKLADNMPDGEANGQEWRTAPLWGIGLTETVNGHTYFLHDGRARSILEAILWHGGEAEGARDNVAELSKFDRDALIAFVNSL